MCLLLIFIYVLCLFTPICLLLTFIYYLFSTWCRDRLYSGSEDKTIRVWNLSTGEAICRIEADENPVSSLAHYGDMLFSGSLKTIKV